MSLICFVGRFIGIMGQLDFGLSGLSSALTGLVFTCVFCGVFGYLNWPIHSSNIPEDSKEDSHSSNVEETIVDENTPLLHGSLEKTKNERRLNAVPASEHEFSGTVLVFLALLFVIASLAVYRYHARRQKSIRSPLTKRGSVRV